MELLETEITTEQHKPKRSLGTILFRFILNIAAATIGIITSIALLLTIVGSSSNDAQNDKSSAASWEIMQLFDVYISNTISTAMDGILDLEMIYILSDTDQVAPEPNQDNFGSTTDVEVLNNVITNAQDIMDGQELFFNTEMPIIKGTSVNYYLDKSMFALTWKLPVRNVVYTFAEVKIQHPSQFRRFLADGKYGSPKQYLTSQMAASVNAVVASAGDFYKYRPAGLVVYNKEIEKFNGTALDSCFIDSKGDLLFSRAGEITSESQLQEFVDANDVRFSLCFGPVLIEDGASCVPNQYPIGEIYGCFSRAAICQLGPLHYLLVTANNEFNYTAFPTLFSFADALVELGIEKAYTLDGGQTATIVMNDQVINRVSYGAERYISDIVYFATAIPESE